MSLLGNLLRAHRRRCDDGRRYLAELENLAERLRADALRLRAAIDEGGLGPLDAGQMVLRHAKVERSIAAIDTRIGEAAAALAVAETELRQSERLVAQHEGERGIEGAARRRPGRRKGSPASVRIEPDRGG